MKNIIIASQNILHCAPSANTSFKNPRFIFEAGPAEGVNVEAAPKAPKEKESPEKRLARLIEHYKEKRTEALTDCQKKIDECEKKKPKDDPEVLALKAKKEAIIKSTRSEPVSAEDDRAKEVILKSAEEWMKKLYAILGIEDYWDSRKVQDQSPQPKKPAGEKTVSPETETLETETFNESLKTALNYFEKTPLEILKRDFANRDKDKTLNINAFKESFQKIILQDLSLKGKIAELPKTSLKLDNFIFKFNGIEYEFNVGISRKGVELKLVPGEVKTETGPIKIQEPEAPKTQEEYGEAMNQRSAGFVEKNMNFGGEAGNYLLNNFSGFQTMEQFEAALNQTFNGLATSGSGNNALKWFSDGAEKSYPIQIFGQKFEIKLPKPGEGIKLSGEPKELAKALAAKYFPNSPLALAFAKQEQQEAEAKAAKEKIKGLSKKILEDAFNGWWKDEYKHMDPGDSKNGPQILQLRQSFVEKFNKALKKENIDPKVVGALDLGRYPVNLKNEPGKDQKIYIYISTDNSGRPDLVMKREQPEKKVLSESEKTESADQRNTRAAKYMESYMEKQGIGFLNRLINDNKITDIKSFSKQVDECFLTVRKFAPTLLYTDKDISYPFKINGIEYKITVSRDGKVEITGDNLKLAQTLIAKAPESKLAKVIKEKNESDKENIASKLNSLGKKAASEIDDEIEKDKQTGKPLALRNYEETFKAKVEAKFKEQKIDTAGLTEKVLSDPFSYKQGNEEIKFQLQADREGIKAVRHVEKKVT